LSSAAPIHLDWCETVRREYALVLIGMYAFMLALNAFAVVLISQSPRPPWLWALNGTVMASELVAIVCCYQRAKSA
jgi:hypothetical protein